jgi:opacity protein-like surface antigen
MKRILFLLLIALPMLISSSAKAQYAEVGLIGGGMSYLGDISEVAFTAQETHPAVYGFIKYNFTPYFGIRALGGYGRISGTDENSSRSYATLRNLSFTSDIYEGSMLFEWNITGFNAKRLKKRFSPYVFAGVSVFKFNPRAFYNGQWYELQPLGTEGQGTIAYPERDPYDLVQVGVPMGGGFRIAVTERWNIGLEFKFTKTFTDYLDDVSTTFVDQNILIAENGIDSWNLSNRTGEFLNSEPLNWDDTVQRGNPADKDWFIMTGITITHNLVRLPNGWKSVKCPTF